MGLGRDAGDDAACRLRGHQRGDQGQEGIARHQPGQRPGLSRRVEAGEAATIGPVAEDPPPAAAIPAIT
jgi:hypothetical protein